MVYLPSIRLFIYGFHVGKFTSPMDAMGFGIQSPSKRMVAWNQKKPCVEHRWLDTKNNENMTIDAIGKQMSWHFIRFGEYVVNLVTLRTHESK